MCIRDSSYTSWSAKNNTIWENWSWCRFAKSETWICLFREGILYKREGQQCTTFTSNKRSCGIKNMHQHSYKNLQREKEKIAEGGCFKLETPNKKKKILKTCNKTWHISNLRNSSAHLLLFPPETAPNTVKLRVSLKDADLFHCIMLSLLAIFKGTGFTYRKIGGRKLLLERRYYCLKFHVFKANKEGKLRWNRVG